MTIATSRSSPAAAALEARLARRCQDLLAAASSWVENPDDEALEGARTLVSLVRARAALARSLQHLIDLLPTLDPTLADEIRTVLPSPPEDSFDDYVCRLAAVFLRFVRPGAPPGSPAETVRYGHLRARNAGLRTQGDVALWVALQALLGRNFHAEHAHAGLTAALTTLATAQGDELPPHLRHTLTRTLQPLGSPPSPDEFQAVRAAQGPAPPPRRPSWHPPQGPW